MGDDFSNRQCYAGDKTPADLRLRLQHGVVDVLTAAGYGQVASESEATRSLVLGPAGRWIFIGDTAGSTGDGDPTNFETLTLALSKILPIVEVRMSDTAAVHIHLYKSGSLVDKYGNAAFPFFKFKTEDEAKVFRGNPELWQDYLVSPHTPQDLREVWVQDWGAGSILSNTARMLGWDEKLSFIGYTLDAEGLGIKYDDSLQLDNRDEFLELHFRHEAAS